MSPRVRRERDADGRLVERVETGGPRVKVERVSPDRTDIHPELRGEKIVHETYRAEDVADWADGLGREGEKGKLDGLVTGEFPRVSRLRERMSAASLDADALAAKASLPAALVERLLDSGEIPSDAHRESLESVLPDAFPERRAPLSMAEQIGGSSRATNEAAETEARQRHEVQAQHKREVERAAAARKRRRAADERERRRNLDSGLSRVASRLDALWERLNR